MRSARTITRRRGFTLIELIATTTILAAISTSVAFVLFTAIDGYLAGSTQAALHRELSTTMDRITRELRSIPLDTAATTIAPDIDRIETSRIDWSGGSRIERLGTTLSINTIGGGDQLLLDDVTNLTIIAYDEARAVVAFPATAAACDPVRRIQIELTVARNGESATLRSLVHLRSTMIGASGS